MLNEHNMIITEYNIIKVYTKNKSRKTQIWTTKNWQMMQCVYMHINQPFFLFMCAQEWGSVNLSLSWKYVALYCLPGHIRMDSGLPTILCMVWVVYVPGRSLCGPMHASSGQPELCQRCHCDLPEGVCNCYRLCLLLCHQRVSWDKS